MTAWPCMYKKVVHCYAITTILQHFQHEEDSGNISVFSGHYFQKLKKAIFSLLGHLSHFGYCSVAQLQSMVTDLNLKSHTGGWETLVCASRRVITLHLFLYLYYIQAYTILNMLCYYWKKKHNPRRKCPLLTMFLVIDLFSKWPNVIAL